MLTTLLSLLTIAAPGDPLETQFAQVAPRERAEADFQRSPGQRRAIVLLQGLTPQPLIGPLVSRAHWQAWQRPGSLLVSTLAADGDIYAFAYGQNRKVEEVAEQAGLVERFRRLRKLGYREVVLIGHSAGGLIARHVVEDHPECGVTKVIQVCPPNGGSGWGRLANESLGGMGPFIQSLSPQGRQECLKCRDGKKLPDGVEFVCLVGHLHVKASVDIGIKIAFDQRGDGIVTSASQWTEDLRCQGVPAVPVMIHHHGVVRSQEAAEVLVRLVREKQPRWDAERVKMEKLRILGE